MPSKNKKRTRKNRIEGTLNDEMIHIMFFGSLDWFLAGLKEEVKQEEKHKPIWERHKDYLMELWQSLEYKELPLSARLFERPYFWWLFDAPEERGLIREYGNMRNERTKEYLIRLDLLTEKERKILKNEQ